jgi:carboxypeptidase D
MQPQLASGSQHGFTSRAAAVLLTLAAASCLVAPASEAAGDPFVPPGHERVRIAIDDPETVRSLDRQGLTIEEMGHGYLELLVDADGRRLLESLGHVVEPIEPAPWPEEGDGAGDDLRTITSFLQLSEDLALLHATYPDLTVLTQYGSSTNSRQIWALKVSDNADVEENEPEVRIVGAHHGNEKMSVQMNVRMAHYLLENYGIDPDVTALVDDLEIWIVPMVNPDGFEANSRYNARGVDLNRNYGYMWQQGSSTGSSYFSESETRAMHGHATENWFSLSLSFHCSGDWVNSVWNYSPIYTEDDAIVWELTTGYAAYNGYTPIRGWYWYETHGDCNDWSYGARSDIDWTIETDNFGELNVWNLNRDAILYIMDAARWGLHGIVSDASSGAPLRARVWIESNGWPVFTDPELGDYHRPVPGGVYDLRFSANGYEDLVVTGVVVPTHGSVTVDAELSPGGGHHADRVEIANIEDPYDTYDNETLTMAILGAPDQVGCSMGRGGEVVVDLGPASVISDGPGDDLEVHESPEDVATEGYDVYGGNDYLGHWTLIGSGSGTTGFDLAGTGIVEARYIRIVDDGDGSASGANPGFELDAVVALGVSSTGIATGPAPGAGRARIHLGPVAPNPVVAGHDLALSYAVPAGAPATLRVFDVQGRMVTTLARDLVGAGTVDGDASARLAWQARDRSGRPLPAGVYLIKLATPESAVARKFLVVH